MRAFQVTSHDAPPSLVDLPVPDPGPGQIRVKIRACALNFGDLLMIKGTYQATPPVPFTLGMEVAGEVDALGDGVKGPAIGTRVLVFGGSGGLAEYGVYDAAGAVPIPDNMRFEDAAAFPVAYGTSHVALDYRARLQPGENLLVLGAAGGVGLTAVELGKLMGANVIACARGRDKLEVAKSAGADHLIDATDADIRAEVKALGGADVVYDPVGGEQFKAAFRACRPEARLLPIGFASGDIPQIPANHLLVKNLTVMGLYWGGYMAFKPQVIANSMRTLFGWYGEGKLSPHVSHVLPLSESAAAYDLLSSRKSTGKVVVSVN
ncbi:NADPH:quinone oxidoreductase family protein [Shimia sp. R11_0]|uniref:Beta-ketoacyl-acyl-carrier-protein synthase I n=1 Tax=Shimia marina TaxID=321267 RepID=A0A0P1EQ05_9RHOB|nr:MULTISPECIES: NADPH:quinone oxidoreductase family protein [Shimia]MBO9478115.1 NADPH:quinone oxidoreductase family protein [Shimia sp. R11_0]CUH52243.1 Beta-ketoacyl-acyl-carrier-protein synthase I [Shimia marina]SFE06630.1 NADPH2:quinone reductase [Shimia marina]